MVSLSMNEYLFESFWRHLSVSHHWVNGVTSNWTFTLFVLWWAPRHTDYYFNQLSIFSTWKKNLLSFFSSGDLSHAILILFCTEAAQLYYSVVLSCTLFPSRRDLLGILPPANYEFKSASVRLFSISLTK